MKINEKDRGQLLRMAGNIACGLSNGMNIFSATGSREVSLIANLSAEIAIETLGAVDKEIERANEED